MELEKLGSCREVSKRETVVIWYTAGLAVLFFVLMHLGEGGPNESYAWQFGSGFFVGNVLGFYVVSLKYRLEFFNWLRDISDYITFIVITAFSLAALFVALRLLSGNGHEAAVMGAVTAVVVCIPSTLESWLEAKKEYELVLAIRLNCGNEPKRKRPAQGGSESGLESNDIREF